MPTYQLRLTAAHIAAGWPGNRVHCPLALALHEQGLQAVEVDRDAVMARDGATYAWLEGRLSPRLRAWVAAYDRERTAPPIRAQLTLRPRQ